MSTGSALSEGFRDDDHLEWSYLTPGDPCKVDDKGFRVYRV